MLFRSFWIHQCGEKDPAESDRVSIRSSVPPRAPQPYGQIGQIDAAQHADQLAYGRVSPRCGLQNQDQQRDGNKVGPDFRQNERQACLEAARDARYEQQ